MAKPQQIAEAKISLISTSALTRLRAETEATHRRAAANGMLKSGNTIIEVKDQCISTLKSIGESSSPELCWALSHTVFASPATIDMCNALAHRAISAARNECAAALQKTVNLCGDARHFEITEPELRTHEQQVLMSINLALEVEYSELKFKRLRLAIGFIQNLVRLIIPHRAT